MRRRKDPCDRTGAVGRAGRGRGEVLERISRVVSVGVIVALFGILRRKLSDRNTRQLGVVQTEIFAIGTQLKIGVEAVRGIGGTLSVLPRGEDDQELAGSNVGRGKGPPAGVFTIVGQGVTVEVHGRRAVVPDFNPILRLGRQIFVRQAGGVDSQKLVNTYLRKCKVRVQGVAPRSARERVGGKVGDAVGGCPGDGN